jgi:glutathione S-transferase
MFPFHPFSGPFNAPFDYGFNYPPYNVGVPPYDPFFFPHNELMRATPTAEPTGAGGPSHPRLTYFGVRGICETIRLIFAEAGVDFEERAIETADEWRELKKSLPYNQLPMVEVDGHVLVQSTAIALYLAKKYGLYPSDEISQYKVDELLAGLADTNKESPIFSLMQKHEGAEEKFAAFRENQLRKQLGILEAKLQNEGIYFTGPHICLADISVYNFMRTYEAFAEDLLEGFPHLQEFRERLASRPGISSYEKSSKCHPMPPPIEKLQKVLNMMAEAKEEK